MISVKILDILRKLRTTREPTFKVEKYPFEQLSRGFYKTNKTKKHPSKWQLEKLCQYQECVKDSWWRHHCSVETSSNKLLCWNKAAYFYTHHSILLFSNYGLLFKRIWSKDSAQASSAMHQSDVDATWEIIEMGCTTEISFSLQESWSYAKRTEISNTKEHCAIKLWEETSDSIWSEDFGNIDFRYIYQEV